MEHEWDMFSRQISNHSLEVLSFAGLQDTWAPVPNRVTLGSLVDILDFSNRERAYQSCIFTMEIITSIAL